MLSCYRVLCIGNHGSNPHHLRAMKCTGKREKERLKRKTSIFVVDEELNVVSFRFIFNCSFSRILCERLSIAFSLLFAPASTTHSPKTLSLSFARSKHSNRNIVANAFISLQPPSLPYGTIYFVCSFEFYRIFHLFNI